MKFALGPPAVALIVAAKLPSTLTAARLAAAAPEAYVCAPLNVIVDPFTTATSLLQLHQLYFAQG